jgi:hypothetical protein
MSAAAPGTRTAWNEPAATRGPWRNITTRAARAADRKGRTASSACSARRRGCSNEGKYVPGRTFGIASSIVPTRVSHVRIR